MNRPIAQRTPPSPAQFNTVARVACIVGLLPIVGCSMFPDQSAAAFIGWMDSRPPEKRVPNWENTKSLMLREAPKVGEDAPDFTLSTRDGSTPVRLSQFEGDRPVVLIFGSWT